ncbi:MAG: PQQ-binding-like beta-propeller repeat protein [Candidatus Brocadiae bacterium]|nr:PQQ-binding-like beta-propeller repeat protein [Candidatus Brocadiia bacterium]
MAGLRVALLLGAVLAWARSGAAEWPQFHGPRRDNMSTETGLLEQWPEGGPTRLWTAKGIGHGFASVAIAHGLIFTTGNVGKNTVITALDLHGKPAWTFANGPAWTREHPGSRSTPTLDGGHLYHKSPLGHLVCLEAKTGRKVWGVDTAERFGARQLKWAFGESPLIDGDRVIVCPGGEEAGIVALDKRTGKTVWVCAETRHKAGYGSAILVEHGGLRQIVVATAQSLVGVRAADGKLLWQIKHKTPYDENIMMPLFHEGHVLFSTGHRVGAVRLKLNVQGQACAVDVVWRNPDLDNHHGGLILHGGHLYTYSHGKYKWGFTCAEWESGKTTFRVRTPTKGALTYADGRIYALDERRGMRLLRPNTAKLDVVSEFEIPRGGKGPTWAHPVVCGGRLYIRHSDFLYAYDIAAR